MSVAAAALTLSRLGCRHVLRQNLVACSAARSLTLSAAAQRSTHLAWRPAAACTLPRALLPSQRNSLHTSAAHLSQEDLIAALDTEIADEEENGTTAELERTFGDFTIKTTDGSPVFVLEKGGAQDKVTVTVNVNECPGVEDGEGGVMPQTRLFIEMVRNGNTLTFDSHIEDNELEITSVGVFPAGADTSDITTAYQADVGFVDDDLYVAICKYVLAEVGGDEFVDFLGSYTTDKDYNEYVAWLHKFRSSVA
eukprot:m.122354 g.122354  ORF g.122354 m.122354 type:complete len:252 (+) comp16559_c0_seq2:118-873(+)